MNQNDPFGPFDDNDRTVIRPMPGGRRGSNAPPVAEPSGFNAPFAEPGFNSAVAIELPKAGFQKNPLVNEALSMISLASRLRQTAVYTAIDELRQRLSAEISGFENRLLQAGVNPAQTRMASYALCAFLDETILNTPWGAQSDWGQQSLLILFHKEAWGGEKFFDMVMLQAKQPAQNLALIELAYLFLSLGFEGKFRVLSNGANALEKYRVELYQLIQRIKGDYERELSPRWQGLKDVRNALVRYVPLWVVGAVLGVALILVYLEFVFALNARSDQVYKDLFELAKQPLEIANAIPLPAVKPMPERRERFTQLLASEIAANMIEVVDDRLLRIRNAFPSGSDQLKPDYVPMLKKIAGELVAGQDRLLVTGHTDNQPIGSARFPSNWHLSASRAEKVGDKLTALAVPRDRMRVEGRADGEPLAPNDSSEHRAINRRVDLLIQ